MQCDKGNEPNLNLIELIEQNDSTCNHHIHVKCLRSVELVSSWPGREAYPERSRDTKT